MDWREKHPGYLYWVALGIGTITNIVLDWAFGRLSELTLHWQLGLMYGIALIYVLNLYKNK